MNKEQAVQAFWSSFSLPAYDRTSVPDDAPLPRTTYELPVDFFGAEVYGEASLWYRTSSWNAITAKKTEIEDTLKHGGVQIHYDGGTVWIKAASPFAQRISDEDDTLRRISMNVSYEFI